MLLFLLQMAEVISPHYLAGDDIKFSATEDHQISFCVGRDPHNLNLKSF